MMKNDHFYQLATEMESSAIKLLKSITILLHALLNKERINQFNEKEVVTLEYQICTLVSSFCELERAFSRKKQIYLSQLKEDRIKPLQMEKEEIVKQNNEDKSKLVQALFRLLSSYKFHNKNYQNQIRSLIHKLQFDFEITIGEEQDVNSSPPWLSRVVFRPKKRN